MTRELSLMVRHGSFEGLQKIELINNPILLHCRCKQSARLNEPYSNVTEEYELRIGNNPC